MVQVDSYALIWLIGRYNICKRSSLNNTYTVFSTISTRYLGCSRGFRWLLVRSYLVPTTWDEFPRAFELKYLAKHCGGNRMYGIPASVSKQIFPFLTDELYIRFTERIEWENPSFTKGKWRDEPGYRSKLCLRHRLLEYLLGKRASLNSYARNIIWEYTFGYKFCRASKNGLGVRAC